MTDHIQLAKIERETVKLNLKGTAPLIVHRWSDKAKGEMLDKQTGKRRVKEFKNPEQQFESSIYRLPDGTPGFPNIAFKAATIGAARYFQGVTMELLKRSLFFHGEGPEQLVRITGSEPQLREDMVNVGGVKRVADIRYRAMFPDWSAEVLITYLPSMMSLDSVVALVNAGGMGGIGEWRPEKSATGSYGTYEVVEQ